MTYHPGKVLTVITAKNKDVVGTTNVQATIEMWDENLFTFLVDKSIESSIREGQVVLVDYRPAEPSSANPNFIAVKILRGKTASSVWERYKKFHEKSRESRKQQKLVVAKKLPTAQDHGPVYLG